MATDQDRRTIITVLRDVIDQIIDLLQTEIRLVRGEINEKLSRFANGAVLLGAAAVATFAAVVLLLQAAVRWLVVAGLPDQWGYLLVGLVIAGLAIASFLGGLRKIRNTPLMPDRTIRQLRADIGTIKEHV
jgi:uncharacterized membrane protein YqjE